MYLLSQFTENIINTLIKIENTNPLKLCAYDIKNERAAL